MTAKTIIYIDKLLKNQKETAYNDFTALKKKFQEKYGTEWIDDILTDYEREAYEGLKYAFYDACAACEDFEKHQWN
jgi:hypothetical protein